MSNVADVRPGRRLLIRFLVLSERHGARGGSPRPLPFMIHCELGTLGQHLFAVDRPGASRRPFR